MAQADHQHHALSTAFWLTAAFAVVELVGGFMANSLALLADAGHMVSDVVALGLAMFAGRIAGRPAHAQMTYGYGRAKVLAAQANGLMLWFLSGWIVWEAAGRLAHPPVVHGGMVLWIAAAGLLINLVIMRWLHGSHDINTRAAYWHVLGDALGSVAAMVAGGVILLTGWMPIDPILSFIVAGILAWGGWRLVRETTLELMEAAPQEVDSDTLAAVIQSVDGVCEIHHIHLWRLPEGKLAMSAHIRIDNMEQWPELLPVLLESLKQQQIDHATLQPELTCYDDVSVSECLGNGCHATVRKGDSCV
ncbi:MAG: cation diffusion facilitator family transporter [Mariprofundus sp.]